MVIGISLTFESFQITFNIIFNQYTAVGEKMSKVEQFFNTVDFSGETDLKDRLRKQLFGNREQSISDQNSRNRNDDDSSRKFPARQLSLDELELVNAAGDPAMQQQNSAKREKSKQLPEGQGKIPWDNSFSGKTAVHDAED